MFYKEIQEQARPGSAFLEHLEAQGLKISANRGGGKGEGELKDVPVCPKKLWIRHWLMPMSIVTPIWCNVCKGLFRAEQKNDEIRNINYSKLQYCMGAETCKFGEVTLYPQYLRCE